MSAYLKDNYNISGMQCELDIPLLVVYDVSVRFVRGNHCWLCQQRNENYQSRKCIYNVDHHFKKILKLPEKGTPIRWLLMRWFW